MPVEADAAAAQPDAGALPVDAGDSGGEDAGDEVDSGTGNDAGGEPDAGVEEADAGIELDAGLDADAGGLEDAGEPDAGPEPARPAARASIRFPLPTIATPPSRR
ncbi:MAG: hypothetical protein ACOX6T_14235 [Myxococcales bacterium]